MLVCSASGLHRRLDAAVDFDIHRGLPFSLLHVGRDCCSSALSPYSPIVQLVIESLATLVRTLDFVWLVYISKHASIVGRA